MVDWSLIFGKRPVLSSHWRSYNEHQQILKNFLESLQQIKKGVDEHLSIKSTLEKDFPNRNGLQLEQVMIWEILMLSPKPMSVEEIVAALAERKALAFVGSRWEQLVNLVGAEEVYFCIYRPGKSKIQGLDIVEAVLCGDNAAFERLKSEIRSSHTWVKEICLGLKGVLSMVKMAAATSDTMMKAQMGIHIQERIREVFGPIDLKEFGKSSLLISGGADRLLSVGGGASRGPSLTASVPAQKVTSTPASPPVRPREGLVPASVLYKPLDKSREEIRLFEILPPTDADFTIRCRLRAIPLHRCSFIAISYVWGDSSTTKDIIINGERKPVTTNLFSCLYNIRSAISTSVDTQSEWEWASLPNLIWVDTVCINQSDVEERNHQIRLMGQIYTRASMVISWLGPHDGTLSTAFRTIRLISSARRSVNAGPNDFEWMRSYPELWKEDQTGTTTWPNKAWEAIDKFLRLPNWRRVWILQEVVLATRLWLMSGVQTLDYSCLVDVFIPFVALQVGLVAKPDFLSNTLWTLLSGKGFLSWSQIVYIEQLRNNLKSSDPQGRQDCLDFIWSTLSLQATDPKDKIFGLLGICNSSVNPDYFKSVREVYSEFAKEYIRHRQNLMLLNYAGLGLGAENRFDLPSWVPDFQSISSAGSSHSIQTGFNAGRHIASIASLSRPFVDDQDHLHTFGHVCDTASAVQHRLEWGSEALFQFCISYIFGREDSPNMTESLQLLTRKEGPLYITGIPRLQALFQTFLQGAADFYYLDLSLVEFYYRSLCFVALIYSRKEWSYVLPNHELLKIFLSVLVQGTAIAGSRSLPDKIFTDFYSWVGRIGGNILTNLSRHSVFQTASGSLGLGPRGIRQDDLVCVLQGSSVPVILRKVNSHYIHVGPCFILGLMDGEAKGLLESGKSKIQEFEIH